MNFIYQNGVLSKLVATSIGFTILCLTVLLVWLHRRKQKIDKRNKQEAIKLRHQLERNKLLVIFYIMIKT